MELFLRAGHCASHMGYFLRGLQLHEKMLLAPLLREAKRCTQVTELEQLTLNSRLSDPGLLYKVLMPWGISSLLGHRKHTLSQPFSVR